MMIRFVRASCAPVFLCCCAKAGPADKIRPSGLVTSWVCVSFVSPVLLCFSASVPLLRRLVRARLVRYSCVLVCQC